MKTYTVKNYKGNLVESLKKFSDSHKGMKIVEACENEDGLKIKAEEPKQKIEEGVSFSKNDRKMLEAFFLGIERDLSQLPDNEFYRKFVKYYLNKTLDEEVVREMMKIHKETMKKNQLEFQLDWEEDTADESKEKIDESEEGVVFSISTISGAKPKRTEVKVKTVDDLKKIWEENGEEELIIDFDEDDGPTIEVYDEALKQL